MKITIKKLVLIILVFSIVIFSTTLVKALVDDKSYLFGKVIYIDAGHGGKDNGAVFNGVLEDEINLKIAGYLMQKLVDLGSHVLISRTSDYDLANIYDKNRKMKDLSNRVKQINNAKVDIFVSIHLNSYIGSSISGPQVFYQGTNNSKLLANSIQNNLNKLSFQNKRDAKFGEYYILKNSNQVGVLVECGFLSNEEERNNLSKDYYQKKISDSIAKGIVDYFGLERN